MIMIAGPVRARCRAKKPKTNWSVGGRNDYHQAGMIGIVDYGSGNLLSVTNALTMVGAKAQLCSTPEQLISAERIVLPGVGAFKNCVDNLRSRGFDKVLDEMVIRQRRPI